MDGRSHSESKFRVVVFSGGPQLDQGVKKFLLRLEEHPEIQLILVLCESQGQDFRSVVADLWRRRRWLAIPLLLTRASGWILGVLRNRTADRNTDRRMKALSGRIRFVPDIHTEGVLARVRSVRPDLGLIYGSPILKPELFQIPRLGTLGIHHGKLPQYRGKKTTFWAMFHGEDTAGVTIQRVNAGLDTGEIVLSGEVPIGTRSRKEVWAELEELGLSLYLEAILAVKHGSATFSPQPDTKGKLYRDPSAMDILRWWWRRLKRRLPGSLKVTG